MSTNWSGPFLHVFTPSNLATRKTVADYGRTVDEISLLSTEGKFEGGGFGSGSAVSTIMNRDNHPLVKKGDIALTFCRHPLFLNGGDAVCAIFIIEDEDYQENADGSGTLTWTGAGISKELQRKVLRLAYISEVYSGETTAWTTDYIFLDAAHQEAEDFYNGGVVEIDGYVATITKYSSGESRIYVEDWQPSEPTAGATTTYDIFFGNSQNDIEQAIAYSQTGWSSGQSKSPLGSFHEVGGRKCIDLLSDIATQAGWQWTTSITDLPQRMLYWIKTNEAALSTSFNLRSVKDVGLALFKNDINYAPIIDCNKHLSIKSGVTRVLASGGDGLSFVGVDVGDLVIPTGFTLYPNESMLVYDSGEAGMSFHQIVENSESFDYIKAQTDTPEAILAAQQRLINACADYLLSRTVLNDDYTAKTVALRDAHIGQSLNLKYEREIGGEVLWYVNKDLWIRSFTCSADASDGVRYVTYDLGEFWYKGELSGNTALADRLKRMGGSGGNVVITGGNGGTAPGVTDHGALTGLADDDHLQYMTVSASRAFTGDVNIFAGGRFDGVDLSAHVADPDAHHDEATAGSHILLSGQQISVNTTSDAETHPNTIIAGDSGGMVQLGGLGIGSGPSYHELVIDGSLVFVGGSHSIEVDAGDLEIVPEGDLFLRPGDGTVWIANELRFEVAGSIETEEGGLTLQPAENIYLHPDSFIVAINNQLHFESVGNITTGTGHLSVQPEDSLILIPVGEVIRIGSEGWNYPLLKSDQFVSGFMGAGWGISYGGHMDMRSAYFEELVVTTFTMEQARVKTGQDFITPSGSFLTKDFTITAVGVGSNIFVEDANGLEGVPIFGQYDYCLLLPLDRSGGGLVKAKVWGQVTNYLDQGDGSQRWTFTARDIGAAPVGLVVREGNVVVDFGQSGDGWINLNAIDQMGSPYIGLGRWSSNPYTPTNIKNPIRLGDLGGITGDRGIMGLFVGNPAGMHFVSSEFKLESHGMSFSLYNGGRDNTGYIRLNAIEVTVDYGAGSTTIRPNNDVNLGNDEQGKPWTDNLLLSTGTVAYSLIDDDPDLGGGSDYIRNKLYSEGQEHHSVATFDLTNMTSSFSSTEMIQIKAHVTVVVDPDTEMRLVAEIQDNTGPDYAPHSREVTIATQETSSGLITVYVKPLEIMSQGDWDGSRIRLHWYIIPQNVDSETIRLDPDVPSIAVGNPLPLGLDEGGDGFIVFNDIDDVFKMRLGGTTISGGGAMIWDGAETYFRNGNGEKVITLDSGAGRSYFTGMMYIESTGGITTYGTTGVPLFDEYGFSFILASNTSHAMMQGFPFKNGDDEIVGGMYAEDKAPQYVYLISDPDGNSVSGDSYLQILSHARATSNYSRLLLKAYGTNDSDVYLLLDNYGTSTSTEITASSKNFVITGDLTARSGLSVGASNAQSADYGQLVLNQAGNSGVIFDCRSTEVDTSLAQGMDNANSYFQVNKAGGSDGGAYLRGISDINHGIWVVGSANQPSSTDRAPVILLGKVDNTTVPLTSNVVVVRNNTSIIQVTKGDGDLYTLGTLYQNFDHLASDNEMVRAVSLLSPTAIRTKFDDFVRYNRDDLEEQRLIQTMPDGNTMINTTGMMRLHSGALWELYQRIEELEERLGNIH